MSFIVIKKRTLVAVLSIILAAVAVAAAASAVIAASRADNGITVVIDAGHGGADGGVVGSATGAKESDINLAIAGYLAKYFSDSGYNVVRTRTNSGAVGGGIKYSKREDMRARRDIVSGSGADLVISVHCNSYPLSSVKGAQAFYAKDAGLGKAYADSVQSYFNKLLNDKPKSAAVGDYYILNCSDVPSVLVECGFLSNPAEEEKLITASYQEKVAYVVYTAIDALFNENRA